MPNHVVNKVYFDGEQKTIDTLLETIKPDTGNLGEIDFEKIIPMPEELHCEARSPHTPQQEANYKKYGYYDWYDWSWDHWGTKWNAYDQYPEGCRLSFHTAWSTPEPVIKRLSEMFPDVEITVEYADEDIGSNCGTYCYLAGNKESEAEGDFEFAAEMWGCLEDYEFNEETGEWEYKGW